jgi:hypothetical protein
VKGIIVSIRAWAEFGATFARTRAAYLEHEQSKAELKKLMPEDAKEAVGHPRLRTRRPPSFSSTENPLLAQQILQRKIDLMQGKLRLR